MAFVLLDNSNNNNNTGWNNKNKLSEMKISSSLAELCKFKGDTVFFNARRKERIFIFFFIEKLWRWLFMGGGGVYAFIFQANKQFIVFLLMKSWVVRSYMLLLIFTWVVLRSTLCLPQLLFGRNRVIFVVFLLILLNNYTLSPWKLWWGGGVL